VIAPIDAKVTFEVEGEPVTLRLNFRSIALAEQNGINLLAFDGEGLTPARSATLIKCLAAQEHPDFTEDHTLAIVARAPQALAKALVDLFTTYGGKAEVGNAETAEAQAT
jgi:hypothetical protein